MSFFSQSQVVFLMSWWFEESLRFLKFCICATVSSLVLCPQTPSSFTSRLSVLYLLKPWAPSGLPLFMQWCGNLLQTVSKLGQSEGLLCLFSFSVIALSLPDVQCLEHLYFKYLSTFWSLGQEDKSGSCYSILVRKESLKNRLLLFI